MSSSYQLTSVLEDFKVTPFDFASGANRVSRLVGSGDQYKKARVELEVVTKTGTGKVRAYFAVERQTQISGGTPLLVPVASNVSVPANSAGAVTVIEGAGTTEVALAATRSSTNANVVNLATGAKVSLQMQSAVSGNLFLVLESDANPATMSYVAVLTHDTENVGNCGH